MKRALMVFLLLCSVLLLLTQRTRAQQISHVGDEYAQNAESTVVVEQNVEETAETSKLLEALEEQPALLNEVMNTEAKNIEIVDQYKGTGLTTLQSKESLSVETSKDRSDVDISRSNDSGNEVELESTSSEASSQSNDSETEAENEISLKPPQVEAEIADDFESTQSADEIIVITTTVLAEESASGYTTLWDVVASTVNPAASNELEETEASTSQSETVATESPVENNTEPETENADTTTVATTESPCTEPGTFAVANDCRAYISCTATATNQLIRAQKLCPADQAYNPALLRCSRDLSACANAFHCELEGMYADLQDNSSYYWCVASRLTAAYYIYHIKCGTGQIFTHELGKCFVDMTNLQDLSLNYDLYMSKSPDEESVREEVKLLRAEEKAKLKEAKLREKIRKKYEKELLKKAAKQAKEHAKLQGISLDDETPYNCVAEGKYAAATESFFDYFICQSKKGSFKAIGMKCADGQSFSTVQNICTA